MTYPPGWPRCRCGAPVLDGHVTCGRAECGSQMDARDDLVRSRAMAEEILDLLERAGPLQLVLHPMTVFQVAALVQLASRYEGLSAMHQATITSLLATIRVYFASCPSVIEALRRGDDPAFDRHEQTFVLLDVDGMQAIRCRLCDSLSVLPADVEHRYCARCHLFHGVVAEARRMVAAQGAHECGEWRTARGVCAVCGRVL